MRAPSSSHPSTSSRILLVDDNKLGLAARKAVLEELGHHVTTAAEGREALASFARQPFDLVITDYKMPHLDGLELIRKIREAGPVTPIILISGYAEALGLTELGTGADVVLTKSASEVQHLIRAVNRLLTRATPRKPITAQGAKVKAKAKAHGG
jgi:CheY-like chemotaxis protein